MRRHLATLIATAAAALLCPAVLQAGDEPAWDIDARLEWLSRTVDEVRSRCENIAEHYIPEEDTAEHDELGRISVHLGRLAKRLHDLAGIYTPVQHFDND